MRRTFQTGQSVRLAAAACLASLLSACGGGAPTGDAATSSEAASIPTHRGDVWEVDPGAPVEAQVIAYLNGLHAFVRTGDDIYTGTTRLRTQSEGHALVVSLSGNATARIEKSESGEALVFANGVTAALRPHQDAGDKR